MHLPVVLLGLPLANRFRLTPPPLRTTLAGPPPPPRTTWSSPLIWSNWTSTTVGLTRILLTGSPRSRPSRAGLRATPWSWMDDGSSFRPQQINGKGQYAPMLLRPSVCAVLLQLCTALACVIGTAGCAAPHAAQKVFSLCFHSALTRLWRPRRYWLDGCGVLAAAPTCAGPCCAVRCTCATSATIAAQGLAVPVHSGLITHLGGISWTETHASPLSAGT
jgi:hypothetical protein